MFFIIFKAFEHRMICHMFEEEGEFDWILRDRVARNTKRTNYR